MVGQLPQELMTIGVSTLSKWPSITTVAESLTIGMQQLGIEDRKFLAYAEVM